MTCCGDSSYYPNYHYPTSMMRENGAQPLGYQGTMPTGFQGGMPAGFEGTMPSGFQGTMPSGTQGTMPSGFPGAIPSGDFLATMPSGPAYSVPVVPMGTGQLLPVGRVEESFIENILRFNKGKIGTFYYTYQGNSKWNAMVYQGIVETAGRDHIIISDPSSGKRFLLLMANLDWVEFGEELNYPHQEISPAVQATLTTTD